MAKQGETGKKVIIDESELNHYILEHYKLCNQYVFHSDTIKWSVFSIFAVLNGILVGALIQSDIANIDYGKLLIGFFGFASSFAWFIVNGRNQAYILDRMKKAVTIEEKLPDKYNIYKIWEKRIEGQHWFQDWSAEKMNCAVISSLILWWLYYFLYCLTYILSCDCWLVNIYSIAMLFVTISIICSVYFKFFLNKE